MCNGIKNKQDLESLHIAKTVELLFGPLQGLI